MRPERRFSQSLDLYLPELPVQLPLPFLLWIQGGGFMRGSKENPQY